MLNKQTVLCVILLKPFLAIQKPMLGAMSAKRSVCSQSYLSTADYAGKRLLFPLAAAKVVKSPFLYPKVPWSAFRRMPASDRLSTTEKTQTSFDRRGGRKSMLSRASTIPHFIHS